MKTKILKKNDIKRKWYVVDATDQVLGRFASQVARLLIGKHKATYTPHLDCGDFVIVVNADKFRVTGKKIDEKIYYRHSFHTGGLKKMHLGLMLKKFPTRAIYHAVSGMLPKNKLRAQRLKRLKLYTTLDHPHASQSPTSISV
jgi:large subunit ribosomal protein L13